MTQEAAVPDYLKSAPLEEAMPGHRFRLYFSGWDVAGKASWEPAKEKIPVFRRFHTLSAAGKELLEALAERQEALAQMHGEAVLCADVKSVAPFSTGLGNEHPMENGFAFLDPYGLPYLPGSGVKGVVRRAAEELALFEADSKGWDPIAVWWLFGFDGSSAYWGPRKDRGDIATAECDRWRTKLVEALERRADAVGELRAFSEATMGKIEASRLPAHPREWVEQVAQARLRSRIAVRGSLAFWDALPLSPGSTNLLTTELMNPHYGHYYADRQPPGDWGQPNPIPFLALPTGTRFRVVIEWRPVGKVPDSIRDRWRRLVQAALDHSFEWLGFGAKTSLGFGQMVADETAAVERARRAKEAEERKRRQEEAAARQAREEARAAMSPLERAIDDLKALDGQLLEERANKLYASDLSGATGEGQRRLAQAIADAFKRLGKWSGKLSEKQKAKVERLKALGAE
jgi:CRISPR-associated protein Cmr6